MEPAGVFNLLATFRAAVEGGDTVAVGMAWSELHQSLDPDRIGYRDAIRAALPAATHGPLIRLIGYGDRHGPGWAFLENREEGAALLRAALDSLAPPAPAPGGAIWRHGPRLFSVDGREQLLVGQEGAGLLEAFCEHPRPMSTPELVNLSGCPNVSQAMRRLSEFRGGVFAPFIRRAGTKGNGGYFIPVQPFPARQAGR